MSNKYALNMEFIFNNCASLCILREKNRTTPSFVIPKEHITLLQSSGSILHFFLNVNHMTIKQLCVTPNLSTLCLEYLHAMVPMYRGVFVLVEQVFPRLHGPPRHTSAAPGGRDPQVGSPGVDNCPDV